MHRSQIPIPEPCCASWNDMQGDDERRFCTDCNKHVVNLSALTQAEALRFVLAQETACIRFLFDDDGQIYFVHPQLRRQHNGLKKLLATAALLAPLSLAMACDNPPPEAAVAVPAEAVPHDQGAVRPIVLEDDLFYIDPDPDIIRARLDELDKLDNEMSMEGVEGGYHLDDERSVLLKLLSELERGVEPAGDQDHQD